MTSVFQHHVRKIKNSPILIIIERKLWNWWFVEESYFDIERFAEFVCMGSWADLLRFYLLNSMSVLKIVEIFCLWRLRSKKSGVNTLRYFQKKKHFRLHSLVLSILLHYDYNLLSEINIVNQPFLLCQKMFTVFFYTWIALIMRVIFVDDRKTFSCFLKLNVILNICVG